MRLLFVFVLSLGMAVAGAATAGDKGKGKGHGNAGKPAKAQSTGKEFAHGISDMERRIINDYLRRHHGNLPAAFANAKPLPPGIAKKVASGRPLPPGIAKRYFPGNLVSQLPPRPGHEWLVVGNDIVLTVSVTGLIVGILNDIL